VQSAPVYGDGGAPIQKILDGATAQREIGVAREGDRRGEIELAGEPRPDLVHVAARHVESIGPGQDAQMIVHRLAHEPVGASAPRLGHEVEARHDQQRRGDGCAHPPPWASCRGARSDRRRPLRGQATLQRERGAVLRQLSLQLLAQQPLGDFRARAAHAPVEMRVQRRHRRRVEATALLVEQRRAGCLAIHEERRAHGA
jgi:hypothetical protein